MMSANGVLIRLILLGLIPKSFSYSFPNQCVSGSSSPVHHHSRREWIVNTIGILPAFATANLLPLPSYAAPALAADVTDKVYVDVKGLPTSEGEPQGNKRIVIGLFGKEAPASVEKLKKLMSQQGLPAVCKPKEERVLQREQLEANKVYNSCIEGESKGVNYDYAQIWRVIQGERLDFGSVSGKYIAREYPNWEEKGTPTLRHDRPGLVSVRRGSDSGFGFTIFPGGKGNLSDLDENHIIVGQVLEGLDVMEQINSIPVVTSAKVFGGSGAKNAPSRACRYGGGAVYCNENKPLIKLTMYDTGLL